MLTDLIFSFAWVIGFFFLAGGIAWLADQVASFHLDGMERVRRLEEKEREREGEQVIKIDTIGREWCLPCADRLEVEGVIVGREGECLGCERERVRRSNGY